MKNISTILMALLVLISTSAFAITPQERTVKVAKQKTDILVSVVDATKDQQQKIYQIYLSKEQEITAAKNLHKGDKKAVKAAIKPLHAPYNRKIKDVIGRDKMKELTTYLKAQRASKKK